MTDAERELLILIAEMSFQSFLHAVASRCDRLDDIEAFDSTVIPIMNRLERAILAFRAEPSDSSDGGR